MIPHTCMVYVKKNATIYKICAPLFDKKSHHTFMVCVGSAGYGIVALFAERATIFAKHAVIRRTHCIFTAKGAAIQQKVPHNPWIAALYETAHCGVTIKVRCFLVGEKRHTCRHVCKCRRGMFVTFFLTYTLSCSNLHVHYLYTKQ